MTMKPEPTDGELEILQLIWKHGPMTVRQIHDYLGEERQTGYTTTLKMMQIMTDKGLLSREAQGRSHLYHSDVSEKKTTQSRLDSFLEATFGGSASRMVMQLLGSKNTSEEELARIREVIDQYETNKNQKS